MLKDVIDSFQEIQFFFCVLYFLFKSQWIVEIMINMEYCFKIQYVEFLDINLKINYVYEKYVGYVFVKKKSFGKKFELN